MAKHRTNTQCWVIAIFCILTTPGFAQTTDQPKSKNTAAEQTAAQQTEADRQVAERYAEMRAMIEGVDIQIDTQDELQSIERSKNALLRTIEVDRKDGSREDGSLWLFSHDGIPVAMVELWARNEAHNWGHTLLVVTSTESIQGRIAKSVWTPARGNGVEFKAIPNTGKPRKKATLRSGQMRQIARRFKCNIEDPGQNNNSDFRLLTEPIHRYDGGDVVDGAIFAFVRGETNPEVLLFIEAKNETWQFGFLRCSSNELVAQLDKAEVWRAKQVPGWMGDAKGPFWVLHRDYRERPTRSSKE